MIDHHKLRKSFSKARTISAVISMRSKNQIIASQMQNALEKGEKEWDKEKMLKRLVRTASWWENRRTQRDTLERTATSKKERAQKVWKSTSDAANSGTKMNIASVWTTSHEISMLSTYSILIINLLMILIDTSKRMEIRDESERRVNRGKNSLRPLFLLSSKRRWSKYFRELVLCINGHSCTIKF